MKKYNFVLLGTLGILFFTVIGCQKDVEGPSIYLLGVNGQTLENTQNDTVVLLFSKYVDPGVLVEDNVTETSNIIVSNDAEDVLEVTTDGFLKKVESVIITYTATDEKENFDTISRNIRIANIAEAFENIYTTSRSTLYLDNGLTYNSTVSVDTRIPGRLAFPKVYSHVVGEQSIYFKVYADLYSDLGSTQYSNLIAYMGTSSDKENPFFTGMTFEQSQDTILSFSKLKIAAQTYTDGLGNNYIIAGYEEDAEEQIISHVEYLAGTKTIKRIVLELNVTKNDVVVDRVTEIYTPN
jgi:hypothetical protein